MKGGRAGGWAAAPLRGVGRVTGARGGTEAHTRGRARVTSSFALLSVELRYLEWFETTHLGIKTVSSLV